MKTLTSLLALAALSAPAMSQALNEDFSYSVTGVFPPAGWANVNNNGGSYPGWQEGTLYTTSMNLGTLTADAASHDDFGSASTNDNSLHSPQMNLGAYSGTTLTFDSDLYYSAYLLINPLGFGNGTSTVECSTDGGATWSIAWSETNTTDGFYPATNVDLAAYAGQSSVDMQFHYFGNYAHCWGVDNVVVDNGGNPTGPSLSISGSCPGPGTANASGMTAGGPVVFFYSVSAGSFTVPGGGCAGLTVPVSSPTQLGPVFFADGAGNVSLSGNQQPNHCGNVMVGAVDVATCSASNVVTL